MVSGGILKRLVLLAVALFGATSFAKMELPPTLTTDLEVEEWSSFVRQMVPEVTTSSSHAIDAPNSKSLVNYIRREQKLVEELKKDASFMAEAERRPPLQILKISRLQSEMMVGRTMNPAWKGLLDSHGFAAMLDSNRGWYEDQLRSSFEKWPEKTAISFFSGWATMILQSQRSALSEPDIKARWAKIKELLKDKDIEEIRGRFKAHLYGIDKPDWVLADLDKAVEEMADFEENVAVEIERLFADEDSWVLHADLSQKLSNFIGDRPQIKKYVKFLKSRFERMYVDPNGFVENDKAVHNLILREIPPYLAIYRGCVGNDCSTTQSWAFPYNPYERNWWIENEAGKHLGYVSGAITLVQGVSCLYIRDVAGPGLKEHDNELVLNGLFLAKEKYGVSQMTIMPKVFTNQNHTKAQEYELYNYANDRTLEVRQEFQDERIREILKQQESSKANYDDVKAHTAVRQLTFGPEDLEKFRTESLEYKAEKIEDPRKDPDRLWSFLTSAVGANSTASLKYIFPDEALDFPALMATLRNADKKPVAEFEKDVAKFFQKYNLPFSNNLARRHETLFQAGHLAAPDAFSDPTNIRQSARFVMDLIWRSASPELAIPYLNEHAEAVQSSSLFQRALATTFARGQQADLQKIKILCKTKLHFGDLGLTRPQISTLLISLCSEQTTFWAAEELITTSKQIKERDSLYVTAIQRMAKFLDNHNEAKDEGLSEQAAALFNKLGRFTATNGFNWAGVVRELETTLLEDENIKITFPIALTYLRQNGKQNDVQDRARKILRDNINNPEVPSEWRLEAGWFRCEDSLARAK
jgi:hypothetical protein